MDPIFFLLFWLKLNLVKPKTFDRPAKSSQIVSSIELLKFKLKFNWPWFANQNK